MKILDYLEVIMDLDENINISSIKEKIFSSIILLLIIFHLPRIAVALTVMSFNLIGPVVIFNIVTTIIFIVLFFFQKVIPFKIKVFVVLGLLLMETAVMFFVFTLPGPSIIFLTIIILLTTFLLGSFIGILSLTSYIVIICTLWVLSKQGIITAPTPLATLSEVQLLAVFSYFLLMAGATQILLIKRILNVVKTLADKVRFSDDLYNEKTENLSITLNSIGDAVIATDTEGIITTINPIASQMTNWGQKEAIGKPIDLIFNIVDEKTKRELISPIKEVMKTKKIIELSNGTVLVSRYGKEYQIADSAAPILNKRGEIKGAVLVFRDVTEKHKKEQRIQESEKQFRNLINATPMGIHTYKLNTDNDLILIGANEAANKILGLDHSALIGKGIYEAFPGLKESELPALYMRLATLGKNWEKTTDTYYKDEKIEGNFSVQVFVIKPRTIGVMFKDLSDK